MVTNEQNLHNTFADSAHCAAAVEALELENRFSTAEDAGMSPTSLAPSFSGTQQLVMEWRMLLPI